MLAKTLAAMKAHASLVVVEHNMTFVRSIADRIVVLHAGKALCEGPPEDVLADMRVQQVYLGSATAAAR